MPRTIPLARPLATRCPLLVIACTLTLATLFATSPAAPPPAPSVIPQSAFRIPHSDYPIAAIVQPASMSDNPNAKTTAADLAAAIGSAQLLYNADAPALRAVLATRNRLKLATPVLVYMGGFTTNPNTDLAALERDLRPAIAMTPVAKLATDIDATTTKITLTDPTPADATQSRPIQNPKSKIQNPHTLTDPTGAEFAIKASTADFSDVKNSSKFCFWLRIGDELMKVTAIEPAPVAQTAKSADEAKPRPIENPKSKIQNSLTITVQRAFDKTPAAPHKAGTIALSPVYLGNRDHPGAARSFNSWPGGPDDLRYALDPRSPAAQKFKASVVAAVMRDGYDGAWFDTFQPRPFNLCDALGRKVANFWDFKTAEIYTNETYLDAMKDYIRGVRAHTRAATGREPILYGNSASGIYARGVKELFNHGAVRDLMDGYCFEDSHLLVKATRDKQNWRATQASFEPFTGRVWLSRLTQHADAAASGLSAICMAGPAGYLASFLNSAHPDYEQMLRYSYASFLLTVTKERTTKFGWPMRTTLATGAVAGGKNNKTPNDKNNKNPGGNKNDNNKAAANAAPAIAPWPRLLYAGIGDPLQENKIPALKLDNSPCYQRRFENGLVIVNPSALDTQPVTVPVPAGHIDAITAQPVSGEITLPPGDATILIRAR